MQHQIQAQTQTVLTSLIPPQSLLEETPLTPMLAGTTGAGRQAIRRILQGQDDRLLVIIGPCSIHDPEAALDYADRLAPLRRAHADRLEIVMRSYFEKPRTTVGWKGLINDPGLDGSFDINRGLRMARKLLSEINAVGVPVATEFLDPHVPRYLSDLVAWAAIGARTTESQTHREMASGLGCPVGFKNGTSGDVQIAIDAVRAAAQPHRFIMPDRDGRSAIATTAGNPDGHIILRGGAQPNYDAGAVDTACRQAEASGLPGQVMIDTSHANSRKIPENQPQVAAEIANQIRAGETRIIGTMVESHLVAGRQNLSDAPLTYGQSVTDGCIAWDSTVDLLQNLSDAVAERRAKAPVQPARLQMTA